MGGEISWENCDLREYLNNDFYNSFSGKDKQMIELTVCENGADVSTSDKVFLLSRDKFERYVFPRKNEASAENWWWLRTAGDYGSKYVCTVYADSTVNEGGYSVHSTDGGVRPVLYLKNGE